MFDPFKDFQTAGYLRNNVGEKNADFVKRFEHDVFSANLPDAMNYLASRRVISYSDFLRVHAILFGDFYPWPGQDRTTTAPDIAISKAGTLFSHPADSRRAVEEGLRIGQKKKGMQRSPGLVMGLFAYGHPFLDGNGRTMLVVHTVLCNRAGFSINWSRTSKVDYLSALSAEIENPNKGILDRYLSAFFDDPQDPGVWEKVILSIQGLDGLATTDTVDGTFSDPSVLQKYREFDQRRGYEIDVGK